MHAGFSRGSWWGKCPFGLHLQAHLCRAVASGNPSSVAFFGIQSNNRVLGCRLKKTLLFESPFFPFVRDQDWKLAIDASYSATLKWEDFKPNKRIEDLFGRFLCVLLAALSRENKDLFQVILATGH